MVAIPLEVQEMMRKQKVIVVGSVDLNGVANVSPRTAFYFSNDAIYWLDFFKHKSQGNFKSLPWVSVAVIDKKKLNGFQLKGKVSFVTEQKEKMRITDIVSRSATGKTSTKIFEQMSQKTPDVIMFVPKAIYSLSPQEESGRALVVDTSDSEAVTLLGI
ncbi:MAG: pyridoxamine 5'-phosphate oxidase family protein [Nitrosopumilaceae archaeon]